MAYVSLFHLHQGELDGYTEKARSTNEEEQAEEPDLAEVYIRAGCHAYGLDYNEIKKQKVKEARAVLRRVQEDIGRRGLDDNEDDPAQKSSGLRVVFCADNGLGETVLLEPTGEALVRGGQTRAQRLARMLEVCSSVPYHIWMDSPACDAYASSAALDPFFNTD